MVDSSLLCHDKVGLSYEIFIDKLAACCLLVQRDIASYDTYISNSMCCISKMGSVTPWNHLCNFKILVRYLKIPIFKVTLSNTRKDFLVSSKPPCKNLYLKAVDYAINYMIHGKIRDSRKTTWLMENYVTHGKLRASWKTTRFTENYVIHGAPVEST